MWSPNRVARLRVRGEWGFVALRLIEGSRCSRDGSRASSSRRGAEERGQTTRGRAARLKTGKPTLNEPLSLGILLLLPFILPLAGTVLLNSYLIRTGSARGRAYHFEGGRSRDRLPARFELRSNRRSRSHGGRTNGRSDGPVSGGRQLGGS